MTEIFANPLFVEITLTIIGLAWTAFKASEFYQKNVVEKRREVIAESVAAAVLDTYREYVKGIKAGAENGKLTAEEAATARTMAKEKAIELASTKGVDLIKNVGDEFVDLWIERKINESKIGII